MRAKDILLLLALIAPSANADPVAELLSAFQAQHQAQQETRQTMGTSQTMVRGYLGTKNGITPIVTSTNNVGYFASKAYVKSVILGFGGTPLASQGMLDIYRYPPIPGSQTGFILLVYNDAAGNANEIYLINDTLP